MGVFFTADLHFNDKNIMLYENRPFENINEMNNNLVKNWNSVVSVNDEVYVVGDFGGDGIEEKFLSMLNGVKYLVKGNHDVRSNDYYRQVGFKEVYDKPVIFEGVWILSHEPIYVCENMPYANIFGHVHNSPIYKTYSSHHYCVSVERTAYKPISFEEVKLRVQSNCRQ